MTPRNWVLPPLTRKNWAKVIFNCPESRPPRGSRFCTVPLPYVGSPTTRPRRWSWMALAKISEADAL